MVSNILALCAHAQPCFLNSYCSCMNRGQVIAIIRLLSMFKFLEWLVGYLRGYCTCTVHGSLQQIFVVRLCLAVVCICT